MYMNFDLDINNYEKKDIEEILDLSPEYDKTEIEKKVKTLRENIINDPSIQINVKRKTLEFVEKAKETILAYQDVVQSNDVMPYFSSHPIDYFKQTDPLVNKIKTISSICLTIDSKYRDNYYVTAANNFYVNLPIKITSVLSMSIGSLEFPPSTYYPISKINKNNFFWVRAGTVENNDLESAKMELPDGTYSPNEILALTNNFLAKLTSSTYLQYIYFSVNGTSQQLIVANNSNYPYPNNPFPFVIDCQADGEGNPDYYTPLPLKLGWSFGFRNGVYTNNSTYLSEGVVQFQGPRYFFLVVDDYNNFENGFYSAFNASVFNRNILARFSLLNSDPANATSSNVSTSGITRKYPGPVTIERLHIELVDEYARPVPLNNMDISMSLNFEIGRG